MRQDGEHLLLVVDAATGTLTRAWAIDVTPLRQDRAYSLRAATDGSIRIAGVTDGRAVVVRVNGATTATPTLAWATSLWAGVGGTIHDVDIAPDGSACVVFDRRGVTTYLSFACLDADGALAWSRSYDDRPSRALHNGHAIRIVGSEVWIAGRIGLTGYDTTEGDGVLLAVDRTTGAWRWGAFYYTGATAERRSGQRIKSIHVTDDDVWLLADHSTGNGASGIAGGHWYTIPDDPTNLPAGDGGTRLGAWTPTLEDRSATARIEALDHVFAPRDGRAWVNAPADAYVTRHATRDARANEDQVLAWRLRRPVR